MEARRNITDMIRSAADLPSSFAAQAPIYTNGYVDKPHATFQPKRYHTSDVFPGFTFGGPSY